MDESRLALLAVWNPVVKPETIAAHVESLRLAPEDRKWTWWGRLYVGKRAIQEVLPTVTHERLSREVERVLYVTNFSSLHALRIDRIHLGPLPEVELRQAPPYYGESEHAIPLWFRVRDIRVVHWQQEPTLTALAEMAEVELRDGAFIRSSFGRVDPYAAHRWDWPVLVDARPVGELFPPAVSYWRAPETVAPQPIQASIRRLRDRHPGLWSQLDPGSQLALASADSVHQLAQQQTRFDIASAAIGYTRALEIELCRRLLLEAALPPLRAAFGDDGLEQLLFRGKEARRWWKEHLHPPTLGESVFALRSLREASLEAGWSALVALSERDQLDRLRIAARLRNDAAHGQNVSARDVVRLFDELWGERPLFARIQEALLQLR